MTVLGPQWRLVHVHTLLSSRQALWLGRCGYKPRWINRVLHPGAETRAFFDSCTLYLSTVNFPCKNIGSKINPI